MSKLVEVSHELRGRRSTSHVSCCVFFADRQLTERLGVLQAAFPADVMERLKRLERHGGIVPSGTDAGFEC